MKNQKGLAPSLFLLLLISWTRIHSITSTNEEDKLANYYREVEEDNNQIDGDKRDRKIKKPRYEFQFTSSSYRVSITENSPSAYGTPRYSNCSAYNCNSDAYIRMGVSLPSRPSPSAFKVRFKIISGDSARLFKVNYPHKMSLTH